MTAQVDSLIEAGLAAQGRGDLASARSHYGRALEADPENPEALHLLGLAEATAGDLGKAGAMLERAVARDPDEPLFRMNLARVYARRRDWKNAASSMRAALAQAPGDQAALRLLGDFELGAENYAGALDAAEQLARANPRDWQTLIRFGETALLAGAAEKAIAAANRLAEIGPDRSDAIRIACGAAVVERRWTEAAHLAGDWSAKFPKEAAAWKNLSNAYFELGRHNAARAAFEPVLELEPGLAANDVIYATLCNYQRDPVEAAKHLEIAAAAEPHSAHVAAATAVLGIHSGDLAEAERQCLKAIALDPKDVRGYMHLANLKDGRVSDAQLAAMEALRDKGEVSPLLAGRFAFALGTIYEARGDIDAAFAAFEDGNARKHQVAIAERSLYSASEEAQRTDAFRRAFPAPARAREFAPGPVTPIFVLGMPRSGTTLAESILAAHPDVHGAGELDTLNGIHSDLWRWMKTSGAATADDAPDALLGEWRQRYFDRYPPYGEAKFVVDKQPANHQSLGLIPVLFPEARIVHMRRNPVETCFSIWRRDFPKNWTYANRLADLGARYAEYARLTEHWERISGPEYLRVQYEELIEDFEAGARAMVAHCGLDWRDEQLAFHENKRVVLTFSAVQVRRPVYRDALNKSAVYGARLAPLRDALAAGGVDLETGALLSSSPLPASPP